MMEHDPFNRMALSPIAGNLFARFAEEGAPPAPPGTSFRITEAGDRRITENTDNRITE